MTELKTKQTDADVFEFIQRNATTEQRRTDSLELLAVMKELTGYEPTMWGPSIIGFGSYHYKSDKSRQEGDWPLVGFSPRKSAISLYVYNGSEDQKHLLNTLGTFTMGKACIYIKKLSDINLNVLKSLIHERIEYLKSKYTIQERT